MFEPRRTVKQLISEFGIENCSQRVKNMAKANQLHEFVDICGAVELRLDRDVSSALASNMPMALYYWEKGVTDKLLHKGGIATDGAILAPRWDPIDGETWSASSPGMDALGDAVQLQQQQRDKAMANQLAWNPSMQGPAGMRGRTHRAIPGRLTTVAAADLQKGGLRPTHEVRPDVSGLIMDIQETQRRVDEAFYAPLFRMASQYGIEGVKNVTATAIAELHEEKLIQLGPVLESLDHALLTPLIEATFHYMQEAEILPPAPQRLEGRPIKVEFISLLAQAQKAVGIAAIERTIGFVGTAAQLNPNALDKLDFDAAIDEFAEQVGPPPSIIVTTKDAMKNREARAKQQQQAAMMEQAEPMANAAKLLSEANERGQRAVEGGA